MSKQRMSHMDALHKVAREQDVRPGFQLLDRVADQELHIAEQEKRIAELEQMVRSGVEINHKLHARIAELEQMVRDLLREGNCLLNAAGDEGMRGETAALDWCCTADEALALLNQEERKP